MKKLFFVLTMIFIVVPLANAGGPVCTSIKDGTLEYAAKHYLAGEPFKTGFDAFGYNYQAHLFMGSYANAYLGRDGLPPYEGDDAAYLQRLSDEGIEVDLNQKWYWSYRNDAVAMKWNDAWLSNKDCDEDGQFDRHYGFNSYIGSGAWETNHMSGEYESEEIPGEMCKWEYFVKIIAVPADAILSDGIWYAANGTEIGLDIWSEFAIIQEINNDACGGYKGLSYKSALRSGLGNW